MNGCCFESAAEKALHHVETREVQKLSTGLFGIWGDILQKWLNQLISSSIDINNCKNLHIKLSSVPKPFHNSFIFYASQFSSRDDLINACMASVHIPIFMNGSLYTTYKGISCIDSDVISIFQTNTEYHQHVKKSLYTV